MNRSAFTLVEILIVVVLLGILAGVVIPQYATATTDSRTSALTTSLQTVRGQLELYKMQHLDAYPPGFGFSLKLINRTDAGGNTGTDPNLYPYGPYLPSIPQNPFVSSSVSSGVGVGTNNPGDGSNGWYWNTATNTFSPGDPGHKNL